MCQGTTLFRSQREAPTRPRVHAELPTTSGAITLPCETQKTHLVEFPARGLSPRGPYSIPSASSEIEEWVFFGHVQDRPRPLEGAPLFWAMSYTGSYAKPVYSPFLGSSEPGQRALKGPAHVTWAEGLQTLYTPWGVQAVSHTTLQVQPRRLCSN